MINAFAAFGLRDYVRNTGKPVTVTDTFTVATPGPAVLHISNGGSLGQYALVSSAVITLNGVTVVSSGDFSQQVGLNDKLVTLAAVATDTPAPEGSEENRQRFSRLEAALKPAFLSRAETPAQRLLLGYVFRDRFGARTQKGLSDFSVGRRWLAGERQYAARR